MSQSMSCTKVTISSPVLADWLMENKGISIEKFADILAESIDGDGSGSEATSELSEIESFAEVLVNRLAKVYPDLCEFAEENAEEIDSATVAIICCASAFPGDPPEFCRLVYENGFLEYDCVMMDEIDDDVLEEVLPEELLEASTFTFLSSITPEQIAKLIDLANDFDGDFDEDFDEDEEDDEE